MSFPTALRRLRLFIYLAAMLLLTGCGDGRPSRIHVAGKVTIDGAPLKAGIIRVVPEHARLAFGTIDSNGSFTLTTFDPGDGCVSGTHKVEVIGTEKDGSTGIRWWAPKKYAKADSSGLTITVDRPIEDLQIKLTWDGGHPFVENFNNAGDFDPTKLQGKATQP